MNTDLKLNADITKRSRKRLLLTLIVASAVFFALSSLILSPLYIYTCSDVVYATTALPEIIDIVIDIVDVAAYAVSFSIIIYSIFKFTLKKSIGLIFIYIASVALRYLANLIITTISDGAFSVDEVFYVLIYLTLDLVLFGIVLILPSILIPSYYSKRAVIEKANAKLGKKMPSVHEELFATKKIFSAKNPLHISALVTGIILSLVKIATRVWFDLYIGAPSSAADAMWMVAYYLSDILIALIVYAISLYIFAHFDAKEQREN
ncbi:MAG: hypothetical protein J6A83_06375 [Clostridia bacterium]|nr:hypothetical protein [Clostridia bacterium]